MIQFENGFKPLYNYLYLYINWYRIIDIKIEAEARSKIALKEPRSFLDCLAKQKVCLPKLSV